jgi:outer membrane protein TolC
LFLALIVVLAGCQPVAPAYLRDCGDLSYYLDQATEVEYPDVDTAVLDEVTQAHPPMTSANPNFESVWDLTLEDVVSIALQNNKVVRGFGTPGLQAGRVAPGVDSLANNPQVAGTMYNVAVRETEPGIIGLPGQIASPGSLTTNTALEANQGVEAALAEFDAQLTSSVFYNTTDQPQNFIVGSRLVSVQDQAQWQTELSKKAATGTQIFFRNVNSYTDNNNPLVGEPGGFQFLSSVYQTALEIELRQPLARGRGTFINRMPVVIARIQSDQEIANLDAQLQNMVTNVEIRYWDLYLAYRNLDAANAGRDAALDTWRLVNENYRVGRMAVQDEAEAREQYYFFHSEVQRAKTALLDAEGDLRWLMGIATTDGRLVRPIDEPTRALVRFDWCAAMDEALTYRPELRLQRWEVKKRQLQIAYAKNSLLPSVNATALYRWLGSGDQYLSHEDPVPDFPDPGSAAVNELMGGNFQEFRVGLDFGLPIGLRRELANVRNAQLKMARDVARLEDMELDVSREVAQALRSLELNYDLAQTNFNRWTSAMAELQGRKERYQAGTDPLTFLLDAQRRRAQGEQAFYQVLVEYNKLVALIHRRKGTILAYNNVHFAEGPWPDKAYWDASEHARRRSASRHIDYGFTRPGVISRGPIWPSGNECPTFEHAAAIDDGWIDDGGMIIDESTGEPYYPEQFIEPSISEPIPSNGAPRPMPADAPTNATPLSSSGLPAHPAGPVASRDVVPASFEAAVAAPLDWQRLGLPPPTSTGDATRATIRRVNHEEAQK